MDFKKKFKAGRMWHEARKQEKKIRGMMVDYKRRAERRREYYERIKQDPAQFLQVHGRRCKIHLDPAIAQAADSPATMMPWQGHEDNLVDRFDVRAHLDVIPEYKHLLAAENLTDEQENEERQANYERYRTLVQNDFFGLSEGKFLHQIYLEERFGPIFKPGVEDEKKKLAEKKAAIGYVYEDSSPAFPKEKVDEEEFEEEESDNEDLSDIDFDVTVNVDELTIEQSGEMNLHAVKYGMGKVDFISYLHQDKDEADQLKLAKEIEEEKAMYSGRKSRRERRALREKKLQGRRVTSPPSYAAIEPEPVKKFTRGHSSSRSRSNSPVNAGQVTFITSFGGEVTDDEKKTLLKSGNGQTKTATDKLSELPSRSEPPDIKLALKKPHSTSSSSSTPSPTRRRPIKLSSHRHKRLSRRSASSSSPSSSSYSSSSSRPHSRNRKKNKRRSRSRSWSSSSSPSSSSRSRSRSRSKSAQLKVQPPVKSYYRHSLSRSNSEISLTSEEEADAKSDSSNNARIQSRKPLPLLGKADSSSKMLTPQEKLKKKMQALLNKQFKLDKKAEMERMEKQEQERVDRAEELREMAIKLRQRERERRHRMRECDDSDSSSAAAPLAVTTSLAGSSHSRQHVPERSSRSRSRGRSPPEKVQPPPSTSNSSSSTRHHPRSRSSSQRRSRHGSDSRSHNRGRSRSPPPKHRVERSSRYQSHWSKKSRSRSRSRSRTKGTKPLVDY